MLLMIDNYDSFTYNLVQYLGELGAEVEGNDAIKVLVIQGDGRAFSAGGDLNWVNDMVGSPATIGNVMNEASDEASQSAVFAISSG